ncbi:hypothetical protein [Streptodolium elevatio]
MERFFGAMAELHAAAGEPPAAIVARRAAGGMSTETVLRVLRGPRLPRLPQTELVVATLGGNIDEFTNRWAAARST